MQEESKANVLEGRECLAGLLREFSDVCRCSVAESMSLAKDVGRNEHFPKCVNKVHKQARSGDTWQICHDALRIMTEGTADEMEQHITQQ